MSVPWSAAQIGGALACALALFAIQCALSVALVSATALSRVALQGMSNGSRPQLAFLAHLREPGSTHRAATTLLRQLCLLGGVALTALAGRGAGWPVAGVLGATAGVVAGVLLVEVFLARLLALWNPRGALRATTPLMIAAHAALYPIVRPLGLVIDRIAPARPTTEEEREEEQEQQVDALIEVGEREGFLEGNEGEMIRSIADLDATLVREIMTPRTDIAALGETTTVAEARRAVLAAGHSRIPVYRDSIDNVVGVLHERDLLRASEEERDDQPVGSLARPAIFVPETLTVAELLGEMKLRKHFALVVDEYGGVSGLVTLEDLLEEIVGEIRDEHDAEEPLVRRAEDGSWIIDAAAHVEELEERFGLEFGEREFDTVGGLVVTGLGRVPAVGEVFTVQGVEIRVLDADRRRIRLVGVRPAPPAGEAQVAR